MDNQLLKGIVEFDTTIEEADRKNFVMPSLPNKRMNERLFTVLNDWVGSYTMETLQAKSIQDDLSEKLSQNMQDDLQQAEKELNYVRYLVDTYSKKYELIAAAYVNAFEKIAYAQKDPQDLRYAFKAIMKSSVEQKLTEEDIAEILNAYGSGILKGQISREDFDSQIGYHFKNSNALTIFNADNDSYPADFLTDFFNSINKNTDEPLNSDIDRDTAYVNFMHNRDFDRDAGFATGLNFFKGLAGIAAFFGLTGKMDTYANLKKQGSIFMNSGNNQMIGLSSLRGLNGITQNSYMTEAIAFFTLILLAFSSILISLKQTSTRINRDKRYKDGQELYNTLGLPEIIPQDSVFFEEQPQSINMPQPTYNSEVINQSTNPTSTQNSIENITFNIYGNNPQEIAREIRNTIATVFDDYSRLKGYGY